MIDLKRLDRSPEEVENALAKKKFDTTIIKRIKGVKDTLKELRQDTESTQSRLNTLSKEFGMLKKDGKDTAELQAKIGSLKNRIKSSKETLEAHERRINELALNIPNTPYEEVPEGDGEDDNVEIRRVLEPREFGFQPKPHWELAEGWIDFERGVKLAGSRFSVLNTPAAKLERALINFFLDENAKAGFMETSVPVLNNSEMLLGTGQLPKFEEDLFKIEDSNLYLIPTGEVPLTNLFNDEIIDEKELPILMTANTPCFRREAGGAGRDTRGMIRQHQFNKVEMVAITSPEQAEDVFNKMVENASSLLTRLGLPHRLVMLCGGDLGFSAAKTIDLEVWIPSEGKYREISSVSDMGDFQARRAKIRYRKDGKNLPANTLNGSALAVGRTIVAIMENYQREDGTIEMPEALEKYLQE